MNTGLTRKVIRLRFRKLKRYYRGMQKEMGMDDIHNFRVEVKKLRAFLRLIQTGTDNKIKAGRSLKEVYKQAGKVRELQLHQKKLKETTHKSLFTSQLHPGNMNKAIADAVKKLKQMIHPRLLTHAQMRIEKKLEKGINPAAIQNFCSKRIDIMRDIISDQSISDTQWHTIRKNLKDILYNAKTFEKDLHRDFPLRSWTKRKEDDYTRLAEELGNIRDSRLELKYLRHSHQIKRTEERETRNALQSQQKRLKQEFLVSIDGNHSNDAPLIVKKS